MPIDYLSALVFNDPNTVAGWKYIKKYGPIVAIAGSIKLYFNGAWNTWERDLHGKVFMITGGTSGLGGRLAYELASKGAQIILLVRTTEDGWLIDYIEDMRDQTGNFMIYAEECNLESLYSIRKFATKWLDNQPPRRLDGIICCAAECLPVGKSREVTEDGIERQIGINYLAHYHLLTLLSPSLRVQPPDRDVRVVLTGCASQSLGQVDMSDPLWKEQRYPTRMPWKVYGTSKLLLGMFTKQFQRTFDVYERPDKAPNNVRINIVNPGMMRTPSTRRFFSMGSLLGLFFYLLLWPIFFLFMKSPTQGMQSILYALFAPDLRITPGGNYIKECKIINVPSKALESEDLQEKLFEITAKEIEYLEKKSAILRKKSEKSSKSSKKNKNSKKSKSEAKIDPMSKAISTAFEKPDDLTELNSTIAKLRSSIGVPSQGGAQEIPLFPQIPNSSN